MDDELQLGGAPNAPASKCEPAPATCAAAHGIIPRRKRKAKSPEPELPAWFLASLAKPLSVDPVRRAVVDGHVKALETAACFAGVLSAHIWQNRAEERKAVIELLLQRANIIDIPRVPSAADDSQCQSNEWTKHEQKLLVIKWLQIQVIAGPWCTYQDIPWERIGARLAHKGSALRWRIAKYKTGRRSPENEFPSDLVKRFNALEDKALQRFHSRAIVQRLQLTNLMERKLHDFFAELRDVSDTGAAPVPAAAAAALAPERTAQSRSLAAIMAEPFHGHLSEIEAERILAVEDTGLLPDGHVFAPSSHQDAHVHAQLLAELDRFLDCICPSVD